MRILYVKFDFYGQLEGGTNLGQIFRSPSKEAAKNPVQALIVTRKSTWNYLILQHSVISRLILEIQVNSLEIHPRAQLFEN